MDAKLVAQNVSGQRRVMFRRAMKRVVQNASSGCWGIKGQVGGVLVVLMLKVNGIEKDVRCTLRADIDYATYEALTTYGILY